MVPCSTQSQFPDLWSAPLRRAHWMPTLGDPGAHAVGVPSRHGDPREDNGEALPHPRLGLWEFKARLLKGELLARLGWNKHLEQNKQD